MKHCQLLFCLLQLLPVRCFLGKIVVFQDGVCRLLARPFHHSLDAEVVNIEGSETNINGRIDSVVGGLSSCCPISSFKVRLDQRWGTKRVEGREGERKGDSGRNWLIPSARIAKTPCCTRTLGLGGSYMQASIFSIKMKSYNMWFSHFSTMIQKIKGRHNVKVVPYWHIK